MELSTEEQPVIFNHSFRVSCINEEKKKFGALPLYISSFLFNWTYLIERVLRSGA